jgi:large subunit ribosomal protein L6
MSRIGNKPIPVPSGVKIGIATDKIDVQGPKGKLSVAVPNGISFEQKDGVLNVKRSADDYRAVHGVTTGFKKELDIVGVGYRAELKGKAVSFALGKSHPIEFAIPEGIQIAVDKQTHLIVSGADKAQVGQVAADLRSLRPPDPYKQKGVRITGQRLKKKAGKAGAKAGA